jgi:pyridoxal phosphate enzyme (YggS family)
VDLVVVTKAAPPTVFAQLRALGVVDVGENRVQAALLRRPTAPPGLVWHGIGHLQRNKVEQAVEVFDVFHALDSLRLAERLAAVLAGRGRRWPVYVQVNAARDPAKGGFEVEEVPAALARLAGLPALEVRGFMTMARLGSSEAEARAAFRTLREVRDAAVRAAPLPEAPSGLSMGMSEDFAWAVAEGATVVRVGSAIFEGVLDAGPPAGQDLLPEGRSA